MLLSKLMPDAYVHRAQLITQAIEKVGGDMFESLMRGGVSRIISTPMPGSYFRLCSGFTTKAQEPRIGCYKIGELYDPRI